MSPYGREAVTQSYSIDRKIPTYIEQINPYYLLTANIHLRDSIVKYNKDDLREKIIIEATAWAFVIGIVHLFIKTVL